MKKVRVEKAVGMELCHDITAIRDDFKGALFKRGHIIRVEDIDKLLDIGKKTIYVWEENSGEIHEEDAALRMSKLVKEENFHYSDISEGKISAISDVDGMLYLNRQLLNKINDIDDITVSTFPSHYPIKKGMRFVSMRIVPLVTKEKNIEKMEKLCQNEELFRLYPYEYKRVGLIITGSEVYNGRIEDKFEEVIREKFFGFPSNIIGVKICDDDVKMIVEGAEGLIGDGAEVLVFTGGMSVDPDDVTPTAISRLAGKIISKGVPSQPGNMTLLAYKGDIIMIGVPGAAIKAPTTVFDALLPQIFTSLKFSRQDMINLGEGGLCQNCIECRFPNCTYGKY